MGVEKRRYPRTSRREPAELRLGRASYLVTVHELSPEGAGFTSDSPLPMDLVRGKRCELHLPEQKLELPATVAWSSHSDPRRPRGGLHFELAIAGAVQRQRFAEWVVNLLRASG